MIGQLLTRLNSLAEESTVNEEIIKAPSVLDAEFGSDEEPAMALERLTSVDMDIGDAQSDMEVEVGSYMEVRFGPPLEVMAMLGEINLEGDGQQDRLPADYEDLDIAVSECGAIYCKKCQMWLNGLSQWRPHKPGTKHRKNHRRGMRARWTRLVLGLLAPVPAG